MNSQYEPTANARQGAKALWDLFQALTAEGFNERQALAILGACIANGQQGSTPQ